MLVGFSLGLTGGGGSIFAVPLLIYGLGLPVRTAVGLSLAVVGLTAGFGAAVRLRAGEVELRAGLVFSIAGMAFAPVGSWLGGFVPAALLLSAFALLMGFVGWRMWLGKGENSDASGPCVLLGNGRLGPGCHVRLSAAGAVAGVLSGLFGIGGGFVVVPALLYELCASSSAKWKRLVGVWDFVCWFYWPGFLLRRGSAPMFPPSRRVTGARSPRG